MPPTGSTFTDWQQVEKESRLLINEDFSWSEPPQRSRRRITEEEPIRSSRRHAREHAYEYERDHGYEYASGAMVVRAATVDRYEDVHDESFELPEPIPAQSPRDRAAWDQPTQVHSHFDEMMEQWNAAYGDPAPAAFDLSDPGVQAAAASGRRTVVITGRGDDRYMPAPTRRRSSELRFHERSTFSPDRAGLWAVLLGLALVIGSIAH